jgi:hypothetical protein
MFKVFALVPLFISMFVIYKLGDTAMPALFDILVNPNSIVTVDVFEKSTFSGTKVYFMFASRDMSYCFYLSFLLFLSLC